MWGLGKTPHLGGPSFGRSPAGQDHNGQPSGNANALSAHGLPETTARGKILLFEMEGG